jgi:hypothetical protein
VQQVASVHWNFLEQTVVSNRDDVIERWRVDWPISNPRSDVNKDWTLKDQDQDKDQTHKDKDKDKDRTLKDKDKDKDQGQTFKDKDKDWPRVIFKD